MKQDYSLALLAEKTEGRAKALAWLREQFSSGLSPTRISARIYKEFDLDVSHSTVTRWKREYGA